MAYEFHYTPTGTGVISGKEVLEQTEDAINDLGDQISGDVQTAIDTANNALNTANTASADAQNAVNTANTAYTAATNAQNTANAAQTTATNAQNAATAAQNDVDALENVVTGIEGRLTTTEGNVTNLTTRMGTAEGNIGNLQTAVSTAQATANSAQQTATTARQQSYVFRYSSTTLVASSTNSNSLLDNTDNLKVGDKVIDSSGVLFSITAIDTANSTFTIGTALIDLAQDSDVVHKSGNETVGGVKTFSNDIRIVKAAPFCNVFSSGYIKGQAPTSNIYSGVRFYEDINGGSPNNITGGFEVEYNKDGYNKSYIASRNYAGETHKSFTVGLRVPNDDIRSIDFLPSVNNIVNLGTSTNKWKSFNGVEPSSLSLPSGNANDVIDISSYITALDGTSNSYTVPANGWISIAVVGTAIAIVSSSWSDSRLRASSGNVRMLYPVLKNETLDISVIGTTLDYARFIPCQGNV